ncbi:MAG: hypothetical protein GY719_00825 [bacterium]|nr:hypothetical protein [bacterium]
MPITELLPSIYVPTFDIKVEGRPLPPAVARRVTKVSVTEHSQPPSQFSFELYDPKLELIGKRDGLLHEGLLKEGRHVEISIGYVDNTQRMVTGRITALSADFPSSGPPTVRVDGFDLSHELTRGTVDRTDSAHRHDSSFSDTDQILDLLEGVEIEVEIEQTPERSEPRNQPKGISPMATLQALARTNGYHLWVEDRTLHFKSERPIRGTVVLEWGQNLTSFSPRLSTAGQVSAVEVRGWDPAKKQPIRARTAPRDDEKISAEGRQQITRGAGGETVMVITDAPVASDQEAKTYAEAVLADRKQGLVTASGASIGRPDIRVGTRLEVGGIGRFDGVYTVSEVTHTVSESGYQTSFQVNQSPHLFALQAAGGDLPDSAAGGHSYGVMSGIVIDNERSDEEEFEGWIKVRLPGLSDDDVGHWARLVPPERGVFFIPEIGDEVLIAFDQGDLNRPYVLGSLWNGEDRPPETELSQEHNVRFLKSRSGHVVRLDDTAGAEKIEIIDAGGGNLITLDTSSGRLEITAERDLKISAVGGTLEIEAQEIVMQSAGATEVRADGGLRLGDSAAETKIEGRLVHLN